MKIVELILDAQQLNTGIEAVSLVEEPAIESNFVALKKEPKVEVKFATIDSEKRILLGPALIPNKPIYRHQELEGKLEEFYVYFSSSTIRKAAQFFIKSGMQNNATLEHASDIDGVSVVETWIKEDEVHDKSVKYGFKEAVGTWYIAMKVDNEEIWQDYVKSGRVKGFSIEGYFANRSTPIMQVDQSAAPKPSDAEAKINQLRQILSEYQKSNS